MEGGVFVSLHFIQLPLKIRPREKILGFEIPLPPSVHSSTLDPPRSGRILLVN